MFTAVFGTMANLRILLLHKVSLCAEVIQCIMCAFIIKESQRVWSSMKPGCSFHRIDRLHVSPYLSNTLTNLCTALYCILLYSVILNCVVLLIYCYVDIIQYNAMHKFVGVLDNPPVGDLSLICNLTV